MLNTGLRYAWTDDDWRRTIGMVACLGFNAWEFWLVPRLFCREALTADFGRAFIRQVNAVIEHAHAVGVKVEMPCSLASICRAWNPTRAPATLCRCKLKPILTPVICAPQIPIGGRLVDMALGGARIGLSSFVVTVPIGPINPGRWRAVHRAGDLD